MESHSRVISKGKEMFTKILNKIRYFLSYLLLTVVVATPVIADDEVAVVTMATTYGNVVIELYVDKAPVTAKNFLQYVDAGHFDGSTFYRTVRFANDNGNPKIEVIQGGRGDAEAPFPPIAHESTEQTGILHTDGVISMARDGVGTASSEFFICIGDQAGLDFGEVRNSDKQGFAAFGRVISGMQVVRAIHRSPSNAPTDSAYVKGQIIENPALIETVRRSK
jgi:peptidyl-prolyl cis-trans isomerase A (cyclophilin A)